MNAEVITCECSDMTGPGGCRARASWLVGVGSRVSDRQYACQRHLNRTCWAMIEAEWPRRDVKLTVVPVPVLPAAGNLTHERLASAGD